MKNLARSIAAFSLTLALSASAGCGESKGAPDLTPFLGTWSVSAAAITVLCDDNSVKAISVTDPTVMVMGTDSDLVDDNPTCPVRYDVSGGVAHAQPGQSCNHPDVVTPMHLLDGTFTLEGAAMAKHNASGKLDGYINISLGQTVLCTFNEMGVYRRGGN
ncbi:MAG TPA: hypothetical protein VFH68_01255 [Polyangia bacterium]|nr:hypothetical protein [Polyangia bacterium]